MKYLALLACLATTVAFTPLKSENDRYIVKLKDNVDVADFTRSFSKSIGSSDAHFKPTHQYQNTFKGFAARLSETALNQLRKLDVVEYAKKEVVYTVSQNDEPWGLDRIDQIALPLDNSYTPIGDGSGATVYLLDSGVRFGHDDFGGRASNFYDKDGGDGSDCNGHGTHVAGTIGGSTWGVAKSVSIQSLRVLDCAGNGLESDILSALEFLDGEPPSVLSVSFSGPKSTSVDSALDELVSQGFVVVAAAGNGLSDACDYSPGGNPNVITVGAVDDQDEKAYFSNFGSCLDLFAPGVGIESAWKDDDGDTRILDGTSFAVPHVSGAAAILLALDNTLTPVEVKMALKDRAVSGAIQSPGSGSPNLLLYIGPGDGPNTAPTPPACSFTITGNNTSIASPNYPGNYDNDLSCEYTIITEEGYYVQLSFDAFDIEQGDNCAYDVLTIYDSETAIPSNRIASVCGTEDPGRIYNSTGNAMHLTFHTDGDTTATGFSAMVTFLEPITPTFPPATGICSCDNTCDEDLINTPNYPDQYGNGEDCSYQFSVPNGYFVNVTFLDFNLETSTTCLFDKLVIYDGVDDSAPEIAELCGATLPDPVFTTGSDVYMEFTTDSSVTRTGFLAAVTATDTFPTAPPESTDFPPTSSSPDCDNVYTSPGEVTSPNWPNDYPPNSNCGNTIQAPPGSVIRLTFQQFELEGGSGCPYDTVTIYDGDSTTTPVLAGPYCDDVVIPPPATSSGNLMHVYFESDGSVQNPGFRATFEFL